MSAPGGLAKALNLHTKNNVVWPLSFIVVFALALNPVYGAGEIPSPERCREIIRKAAALNPNLVQTQKKVKRPVSKVRVLLNSTAVALTMGSVFFGAPTIYHNLNARVQGLEHLGLGIYLDIEKVESLIKPDDLIYIKSPNRDPVKVASILSGYLHGDYVEQGLEVYPESRRASDYICGGSASRGMCRHKAVVLAGLLNHYGIEAHIEGGKQSFSKWREPGHVWVIIDRSDMVADPTSASLKDVGFVVRREDYLKQLMLEPDPDWLTDVVYGLGGGAFR